MGGLGRDLEGTQEKVSIRAIQAVAASNLCLPQGCPPPHHILLWVGYCWVWYCWDSLVPLGLCGNDGLSENLAVPVFWLESLGRFWLPWVVSIREEAPHTMGHLRLL